MNVQDGVDPTEMLEAIQIRYSQHEQCHKIISTPEYINELKRWHEQVSSMDDMFVSLIDPVNLSIGLLPQNGMGCVTSLIHYVANDLDAEREYRRSVIAQWTAAERAVKWQADTQPVGQSLQFSYSGFDSLRIFWSVTSNVPRTSSHS
jgi:hypothetical protein